MVTIYAAIMFSMAVLMAAAAGLVACGQAPAGREVQPAPGEPSAAAPVTAVSATRARQLPPLDGNLIVLTDTDIRQVAESRHDLIGRPDLL